MVDHGERVLGLLLEAAAGGLARGRAVAAPVEGDDRDPGRRQDAVQMLVEVPVADATLGAVQRDERRRAVCVRPGKRRREDSSLDRNRQIGTHSPTICPRRFGAVL